MKAYTEEPDGTRVYIKSGKRYKPAGRRVNGVRRPDHPDAVRFHTEWFLPLPLLEDSERAWPETTDFRDGLSLRRALEPRRR